MMNDKTEKTFPLYIQKLFTYQCLNILKSKRLVEITFNALNVCICLAPERNGIMKREGSSSQRSGLVDFSTDGYFFEVYVSASFCLMKITFAIAQRIKVEKYISDSFPWTSIFAWLLKKKPTKRGDLRSIHSRHVGTCNLPSCRAL